MKDLQRIIEESSTSTNRVKLPVKVSEPLNFRFEDLESIQEEQAARRRERVQEFQTRGW